MKLQQPSHWPWLIDPDRWVSISGSFSRTLLFLSFFLFSSSLIPVSLLPVLSLSSLSLSYTIPLSLPLIQVHLSRKSAQPSGGTRDGGGGQ
jgi:hypothetical protein